MPILSSQNDLFCLKKYPGYVHSFKNSRTKTHSQGTCRTSHRCHSSLVACCCRHQVGCRTSCSAVCLSWRIITILVKPSKDFHPTRTDSSIYLVYFDVNRQSRKILNIQHTCDVVYKRRINERIIAFYNY